MKHFIRLLWTSVLFTVLVIPCSADPSDPSSEELHQLEDVWVKGKSGAPGMVQAPDRTDIDLKTLPTIAVPASIVDVLKGHAIIDFRGESDMDPGVDSVYLRGFDAKRFVTALDGLTLQKTGGRKSSNIVDYASLPAFLIDSVEILPGPHSALFDSKSIGGVLNLKAQKPRRRDSLKPDAHLVASYGSYDNQMYNLMVQGGLQTVTYDLAYQKSASDGYLRNNATDTEILYGRLGVVLPLDGFLTFSATLSDIDRNPPVNNSGDDFDADYPEVTDSAFEPWAEPTWDGLSYAYRLNYEQSAPIGRLSLGAFYGKDNRDRAYYASSDDTELSHLDTDWWQYGGKIQDEIQWSKNHVSTVGFDLVRLYDDGLNDEKTERINKKGGYLQHQWAALPMVDLRLGLRYEDVRIRVTNTGGNAIPSREEIIERDWDQLIPKSFVTWKMNHLADWLRDTSLSAGISKIWRAPDYHGDYNPQGRPAGAWIDPEHGLGYDLVLNRRLWRDIKLQVNYAFYQINDYIATNSTYAQNSGANAGSQRYSDYKINLDEVHRHSIDIGLGGHLTDRLSFNLTYAWQTFDNQGDEPAGETELDTRAEHRFTAQLVYQLFDRTALMLDYHYQSEELTEIYEEMNPDDPDDDYFSEIENPAYQVVDLGLQQVLYKSDRFLQEATLKVYVRNLLDEEYDNPDGYPALDRTFGVSLSLRF